MARKQKPRCIHCPRVGTTRDHAFPNSWYPTSTPPIVQRPTVPSCDHCQNKFSKIEKELLVRLGLCMNPTLAEASGISTKALRSLGVGVFLSPNEKRHRYTHRGKILSEMAPISSHQGELNLLPGASRGDWFPASASNMLVPVSDTMLREVLAKIVRGLEYKRATRYIDQPYELEIHLADPGKVAAADKVFLVGREYQLGPGFKYYRRVAREDQGTVLYRMVIWGSITCYASIIGPDPR